MLDVLSRAPSNTTTIDYRLLGWSVWFGATGGSKQNYKNDTWSFPSDLASSHYTSFKYIKY